MFKAIKPIFKYPYIIARKFCTFCHILFSKKTSNAKKCLILEKLFKPLMLSRYGNTIREFFPVLKPSCWFFPRMPVILCDGDVTTCCHDPFGHNVLGSVYDKDISEIWNNKVRKIVTTQGLYSLNECKTCLGTWRASMFSRKTKYINWRDSVYRYPNTIQIEVMGKCNYGCCCANKLYKYRKNKETKLDLNKIFKNIKSFLPKIEWLYLYNYGEPLLHDHFCEFTQKCREESDSLGLRLATNGIFMNEDICRCLITQKVNCVSIGIHGGPGTENMLKYSKYGADYDKVLANIKILTDLRKEYSSELPYVEIRAVLFAWNDSDEMIDRLRQDVKAAGVDRIDWALDYHTGEYAQSSKRFTLDNNELKKLRERDIYR